MKKLLLLNPDDSQEKNMLHLKVLQKMLEFLSRQKLREISWERCFTVSKKAIRNGFITGFNWIAEAQRLPHLPYTWY